MNWLRKLVFPLVPIYYLGALINKKLYDWNIKKSTTYNFPLITVGNLSVGGTGKSPMVSYLVNILGKNNQIATLSRGYKRKSKGFQLVTKNSTALEVGDEPLQFKLNYPEVTVAVDADRRNGIEQLLNQKKKPTVLVLDDAFQHRKVKAGLQIVLTAYNNLYINDCLLPTGDLREPISAAKRAHIVVVTKCPEHLNKDEMVKIETSLKLERFQKLFFTSIVYDSKVKNKSESIILEEYIKQNFVLVTGIANPKPLVDYLDTKAANFKHFSYPDHHNFTDKELLKLSKENRILTTEKDFMRLSAFPALAEKLYYLPITISFIENKTVFDLCVSDYVDKYM